MHPKKETRKEDTLVAGRRGVAMFVIVRTVAVLHIAVSVALYTRTLILNYISRN
jgi:hypothetical protein